MGVAFFKQLNIFSRSDHSYYVKSRRVKASKARLAFVMMIIMIIQKISGALHPVSGLKARSNSTEQQRHNTITAVRTAKDVKAPSNNKNGDSV